MADADTDTNRVEVNVVTVINPADVDVVLLTLTRGVMALAWLGSERITNSNVLFVMFINVPSSLNSWYVWLTCDPTAATKETALGKLAVLPPSDRTTLCCRRTRLQGTPHRIPTRRWASTPRPESSWCRCAT